MMNFFHSHKSWVVSFLILVFILIASLNFVSAIKLVNKPFAGFLIGKARNVYPVGVPGWEVFNGKFKVRDQIIEVNGVKIESHIHFLHVIQKYRIGAKVIYTIKRDDSILKIKGVISIFTPSDLFYSFGIFFIIGILYFGVGIAVFFSKSFFSTSVIFAFFSCSVGTIFLTFFDTYTAIDFVFFFDFAWHLLPGFLFHLAMRFPVERCIIKKHPIYIYPYVLGILFWIGAVYYETSDFATWSVLDRFFDIFMLFTYSTFLGTLIYNSLAAATSILKKRAQITLLGMFLSFIVPGGVIIAGALGIMLPVNFPMILTALFPFYLGHTILKHNFFDSDRVVVNSFFYLIFIILVAVIIFFFSILTNDIGLNGDILAVFLPRLLLTLLIVFSFSFFREKYRKFIDNHFFKYKVDSNLFLQEIGRNLRILIRINEKTVTALQKFWHYLGIENGLVCFLGGGKGHNAIPVINVKMPSLAAIKPRKETYNYIERVAEPITTYDLQENILPVKVDGDLRKIFKVTGGLILIPLIAEEKLHGIMILGDKMYGNSYRSFDIELLEVLAGYLAAAKENFELLEIVKTQERFEQELLVAATIQKSFLPEPTLNNKQFNVELKYDAAKKVGGDIYDFSDQDDKLHLVLGDVSGKGLPAALFGAITVGFVKANRWKYDNLEDFSNSLNSDLVALKPGRVNVALGCMVFDFTTFILHFVNAGIPYPIHIRKESDEVFFIEKGGFPLAIFEKSNYASLEIPFQSGDVFVFYSDGIPEAENKEGKFFGFDLFLNEIKSAKESNAIDMIVAVYDKIKDFVGDCEQNDDQTLVIVEIK